VGTLSGAAAERQSGSGRGTAAQLGGRPDGSEFYDRDEHVLYDKVAATDQFAQGIRRIEDGMKKYRVSMLCSEEDPAVCHRALLVGRVLRGRGARVEHIRGNERI